MATSTAARRRHFGRRPRVRVTLTARQEVVVCPVVPSLRRLVGASQPYLADAFRVEKGLQHFPAGSLEAVADVLRASGFGVDFVGERHPPGPPVTPAGVGAAARRLVTAVGRHARGLIEVANEDDVVGVAAMLAQALPRGRVALVVTSKRDAGRVGHALSRRAGDGVGVVTGSEDDVPGRRAVVYTPGALEMARGSRRDLLLLTSPGRTAPRLERLLTGGHACSRAYGLLIGEALTYPYPRVVVRALLGGVISTGPHSTTPRVLTAPSPVTRPVEGRGLARKRKAYWRNRARNRAAAALAAAALAGNCDTLVGLGLDVDESDLGSPEGRRVAVLVESTEHHRELRSLLKGWPLLHDVPGRLPGEADAGNVVTETYARLRRVDADVLVRATGGCTELPRDVFIARDGRPAPLVIDLEDDSDDESREDTCRRVRDYRSLRWPVLRHCDPTGPR